MHLFGGRGGGRGAAWMAAVAGLLMAADAQAQPLRVVAWNITNYTGGRVLDIQAAVYGEFNGRTMSPDVIVCQEFSSQNAVDVFLFALNNFAGGPTDWAAAPFVNGPDTDNAMFYRTSRVDFVGHTVISVGGASPNPPRNTDRYDFRPEGYTGAAATVAIYSTHMKAQESGGDDDQRRLVEAQRIVANIATLPPGWHAIMGGDTNIQSSATIEYQALVGPNSFDPTGPLFDPIRSPGTWNNNFNFRFVHTQDPSGAGGMDDRHDQILLGGALLDGAGFDYVGSLTAPYSTTTWDDPNHSYRSWGNDGTTFNAALRVVGNTMVGPAIAQALQNVATGNGGHLPVFLDLRVPAEVDAPAAVDFGQVQLGAGGGAVEITVTVANAGDVVRWTGAGLADLRYTLEASSGFGAPGGMFSDAPDGGGITHTITMDTATPGPKTGVLTILSDAADEPARIVLLSGEVLGGACQADWNGDGAVNSADISAFLVAWLGSVSGGTLVADFNGDGAVNSTDISSFLSGWLADLAGGC